MAKGTICCSASSTKLYGFMSGHRWVPLLLLAMVYVTVVATLGGCYAMASSDGHLNDFDGLPAISVLGDKMPEHALFAAGFALLTGLSAWYRLAQLDEAVPGSGANNTFFALVLVGLPCIIVMAAIPTSSSAGAIHLGAAAVGLLLLAVSVIAIHIWATLKSCQGTCSIDAHIPARLRYALYWFCILSALTGPVLFGVWISDVSQTPLEWAGVSMVFVSLLPYFVFFACGKSRAQQQYLPLREGGGGAAME